MTLVRRRDYAEDCKGGEEVKILGKNVKVCKFFPVAPFVFVLSVIGWLADRLIRMERRINAAFWMWCADKGE